MEKGLVAWCFEFHLQLFKLFQLDLRRPGMPLAVFGTIAPCAPSAVTCGQGYRQEYLLCTAESTGYVHMYMHGHLLYALVSVLYAHTQHCTTLEHLLTQGPCGWSGSVSVCPDHLLEAPIIVRAADLQHNPLGCAVSLVRGMIYSCRDTLGMPGMPCQCPADLLCSIA